MPVSEGMMFGLLFLAGAASYVSFRRRVNEVVWGMGAALVWVLAAFASSSVRAGCCTTSYPAFTLVAAGFAVVMLVFALWAAFGRLEDPKKFQERRT